MQISIHGDNAGSIGIVSGVALDVAGVHLDAGPWLSMDAGHFPVGLAVDATEQKKGWNWLD